MGVKFAEVVERMDLVMGRYWALYVAGGPVDLGSGDGQWARLQSAADRTNAAVDAEVERRLDEITKGVGA